MGQIERAAGHSHAGAVGDEGREEKLKVHWSLVFPEISYEYDKDQRFYHEDDVTDAFYTYNELAYRRAELVLGTSELAYGYEPLSGDEEIVPPAAGKGTYSGDWEPESSLGRAVYAAGFFYLPEEDIISSTMNNVQRLGGYCRGYDEGAIAIDSVIDCDPICFSYEGYDWMLELWKGQYGIETGCEIGVYYREQDKPLNIAEKTVLGKLHGCVPDEHMLDMRFVLWKDGYRLFARDWARHWWLTGFRWGLLSEPEQLTMAVGIRFPARAMQQAFVHQGLEKMEYSYMETGYCSVEFCFARPVTKQPDLREKLRKSVQTINQGQVDAYNSFRRKYGITLNDPNIIGQVIDKQPEIAERKLYEKLIRHFNRRVEMKGEVQKRMVWNDQGI